MGSNYDLKESDRVFTAETFRQFNQLNENTNSRIPIFFCIVTSGSMATRVGIFQTRISLLVKVMRNLLVNMKKHPVLSERAMVGIVTYDKNAILAQTALDLCVMDIDKALIFETGGQTVLSKGLRRTLQAIDQYRDSLRQSDVETFVPIMVFMTDGQPVGDSDAEIAQIYNEIRQRVMYKDLYVFPIGISREANMNYVTALDPESKGYQMLDEKGFETVFSKIGELVDEKPSIQIEETVVITKKASSQTETMDTGAGTAFDAAQLERDIAKILNTH